MTEEAFDLIVDDLEKDFSVMPQQKFVQSGDLKKNNIKTIPPSSTSPVIGLPFQIQTAYH
jgi:hypothetical protein